MIAGASAATGFRKATPRITVCRYGSFMSRATVPALTRPQLRANVSPAYLEHLGHWRPMPGGRGTDITQHDFPDELVRHRPALERSARRLCRNRHDAEDLVQATLARAWQRRAQFMPGGNIGGWLYRILSNHHRDNLRRKSGIQVPLPEEVPDVAAEAGDDPSSLLAIPSAVVLEALQQLPDELRRPLELSVIDGKRYREI